MQGPQDLYLCHILSSVINGNTDPPSPRGCCPKRIDDAGFSKGVRERNTVLSGNIMILQGVRHPISCLQVCYANDPPKGGCTGLRLRLINNLSSR